MSSTVEICNLALSHIGRAANIVNFDDRKEEAEICKQYFDVTRREILRSFPWSFADASEFLVGMVEFADNQLKTFRFSYPWPADCVKPLKVPRTRFKDDPGYEFKTSSNAKGKTIETDSEEAVLEYTRDLEEVTVFPEDFVVAFSFLLAYFIAPRLTQGDPFKLRDSLYAQYQVRLDMAKENELDSGQVSRELETSLVKSRDDYSVYQEADYRYGDGFNRYRYYPIGSRISG